MKELIKEENRTQKKKCVEIISNNCNPSLRPFLNKKLTELPRQLQISLNSEGALFKSVSNNTNGCDKFIDYLRLNLYSQFGIGRNSSLSYFIPGISRLACVDCKFYAFDLSIDGGKILKLSRVLKLIQLKTDFMLNGLNIDSDFNGMSYNEFMRVFEPKVKEYKHKIETDLSSDEYKITHASDYDIIPIPDRIVSVYGGKVLKPTAEGRQILNNLSRYTDWCICGNQYADEEYSQYTSDGGKVYICLKHGYKNIKKPSETKTPLDEYGLSLICVIIGEDGLPNLVTTRYNHDFGGENHSDFWEATHLQKILKVNFKKVFKPRSKTALSQLNLNETITPQDQVKNKVNSGIMDAITVCGAIGEGAEPESDKYNIGFEKQGDFYHINEENDVLDMDLFNSISEYMKEEGLNVYPFPEIELDWEEQDGLFIKTGYYLPKEKKIVVFCKDRHPKDILRSYSHEMIHHMQNLEGKNLNFSSNDDVKDNGELEELESEAYLKGNIYFRKWTEHNRKNDENELINENKIIKESPYKIEGTNMSYQSMNAYPFITYKGYDDVLIGLPGGTHDEILMDLYNTIEREDPFRTNLSEELVDAILNKKIRPMFSDSFGLWGRYFFQTDNNMGNIISFYNYDLKLIKQNFSQVIDILKEIMYYTNSEIDINKIDFDHWGCNRVSRFPLKWISNGYAEMLLEVCEYIEKDIINNEPIYIVHAKNGRILHFNLDGRPVENTSKNIVSERILTKKELFELTSNMEESLTPNEVDLSSFNIKKNLNPKFWKDDRLDTRIRIKLLDIADDFIEFLGVDWVKPEDITITGSLANYNWSQKYSDIDLHIIMDFSKVDEKTEFVENYFYSQKKLWNDEHKDLKIFGFPVEIFVQDINKEHTSSGVYSLEHDKWIEEPKREKLTSEKVNKNKIKKTVSKYTEKIDALIERSKNIKNDDYESRKLYEDSEDLFDEIKNLRRKDLSDTNNEINEGNIIFKCLRRLGYIEKLDKIINKGYNTFNSLP